MNAIDSANKEFYNYFADAFDFIPFGDKLTDLFREVASPCTSYTILEIGSGGGAFALWLVSRGHTVTCVEPSEQLAEKVHKKKIAVHNCTLQKFKTNEVFDVVVAISSLIHIPKNDLPAQIAKISTLLKPNGLLFVSFLLGEKEGFEDPTETGKVRYFSKYSQEELDNLIAPYFKTIKKELISVEKMKQTFILMALQSLKYGS